MITAFWWTCVILFVISLVCKSYSDNNMTLRKYVFWYSTASATLALSLAFGGVALYLTTSGAQL